MPSTLPRHTYLLSNRKKTDDLRAARPRLKHFTVKGPPLPEGSSNPTPGSVRFLIGANASLERSTEDLANIADVPADAWMHTLRADLSATAVAGRQSLGVYIHGFATTYSDAVAGLAAYSLAMAGAGFPGVVVGVTWPSDTYSDFDHTSYYYAQQNALQSLALLQQVMRSIASIQTAVPTVDVSLACHSMGNFLLAELASQLVGPLPRPINVMMLAADVDNGQFAAGNPGGKAVAALASQVSIYYSTNDDVLYASGWINDDIRLGYSGPSTYGNLPANVVGIDCAAVAQTDVCDWSVPSEYVSVGDDGVHSSYRFVPCMIQDQMQQHFGLPTPHRIVQTDSAQHFVFQRFVSSDAVRAVL
jgi:esterase/lipase superfamily enzyme